MEFKPNNYTQEASDAIVLKFKDCNKGVVLNRPFVTDRDWDSVSAKWSNLIDPNYTSIRNIKSKMYEIYAKIRNTPEDSVLGDSSIEFTHKTSRGKIVLFSKEDMYIFLREAIKERIASEEYKTKLKQYEADMKLIAENKPANQVLDEAKVRAEKLAAELGIETPSESIAESTKETAVA